MEVKGRAVLVERERKAAGAAALAFHALNSTIPAHGVRRSRRNIWRVQRHPTNDKANRREGAGPETNEDDPGARAQGSEMK